MRRLQKRAILLPMLSVLILCFGCARSVPLKQVMADPGSYRGKTVTLTGVVDKPVAVAGQGVYRLSEGDAHVWVKTTSGVPQTGTTVRVTGQIYDAYDLGGAPLPLPEAIRKGVILLESSRTARP